MMQCRRRCGLWLGGVLLTVSASATAQELLKNGSFELMGLPQGWDLQSLGPPPVATQDDTVRKEGEYSLRLTATEPTLAGISQIVSVEPGRPYVLQGWLKTRDLKAEAGASMIGTLMILPVGEEETSAVIRGPEHAGDTDWTQVRVEFTGPDSGQVFVFATLVGEGQGTGTMWVDGLELLPGEPVTQPATAPATEPAESAARVAQRLRNGSFEIPMAPEAWDVMLIGPAPVIAPDTAVVRSGRYSVRIAAEQPTLVALAQTVKVEPGRMYALEGWIRIQDLKPIDRADMYGTLVVLAAGESEARPLAAAPNAEGTRDWFPVKVEFKAPDHGRVHVFASFCGQGQAQGTIWFDDLRLIPGPPAPTATQTAPATSTAPAS